MTVIFSISFAGFTNRRSPTVDISEIRDNRSDGNALSACRISLPAASLQSDSVARRCANRVVSELCRITECDAGDDAFSINVIGVSESCGLIRFMFNNTIDIRINAVVISACFDRARTPFGSPFSPDKWMGEGIALRPTPAWFDWRDLSMDDRYHLLICHATKDLNPSTPFLDAMGFFLRTVAKGGDVTLIQIAGVAHGYDCLAIDGIFACMMRWTKERNK